jgi:hypothetical protein
LAGFPLPKIQSNFWRSVLHFIFLIKVDLCSFGVLPLLSILQPILLFLNLDVRFLVEVFSEI